MKYCHTCDRQWIIDSPTAVCPYCDILLQNEPRAVVPAPGFKNLPLEKQSELFKAFEWLRAEALKGNKHAEVLLPRVEWLERKVRQFAIQSPASNPPGSAAGPS